MQCPRINPANIYLVKVNKRNTKKRYEINSNLTIMTSHLLLGNLLLTMKKQMFQLIGLSVDTFRINYSRMDHII